MSTTCCTPLLCYIVIGAEIDIMRFAELVPIILQASIFLVVLGFGLKARAHGPLFARHGGLVLRSLLTIHLIIPIITILAVMVLDPIRPVKIALVLLAISPVPPFLPPQQFKLSRDESFISSLFVASALLAIVSVPASLRIIDSVAGLGLWIPTMQVLRIIALSILIPLAVGVVLYRMSPSFAARIEPFVSKLGTILLALVVVVLLFATWRAILGLIGDGTVLIIGVIVGLALLVGHMMGGPRDDDRVVLALSSAARHPGVAMAIAAVNFPTEHAISAAVALYLILNTIFSVPYKVWWKRSHAVQHTPAHRPLLH
jgi:BASS family bile acid:Na+ symporter